MAQATIRVYTEGDDVEVTREQADRLQSLGFAYPNESTLGVPDDDGALRMHTLYAADNPDAEAMSWWQVTASEWVADARRSGPRRPIYDVPATGRLIYRHEDGTVHVIDRPLAAVPTPPVHVTETEHDVVVVWAWTNPLDRRFAAGWQVKAAWLRNTDHVSVHARPRNDGPFVLIATYRTSGSIEDARAVANKEAVSAW